MVTEWEGKDRNISFLIHVTGILPGFDKAWKRQYVLVEGLDEWHDIGILENGEEDPDNVWGVGCDGEWNAKD